MYDKHKESYRNESPFTLVEVTPKKGRNWTMWQAIDSYKEEGAILGKKDLHRMLQWLKNPRNSKSVEVEEWKKYSVFFINTIQDEGDCSSIAGIAWGTKEDDFSGEEQFIVVSKEFPGEWRSEFDRFASRRLT